ncbi:helix-turn-helix transcriptional regulator [Ciceribacter sp. L1K23]|uniref:winged helix-turn-helix transcriptional regulator n=1 Tax=Ciceribacter sp. L1K23 TaxID=2820276 RepID=UPI001B82512C|nr:helix-turn-helix domain-containing protein [Ciceribacter sp. L1K23]MBR0556960.1 helix-turn-helix transcriptional regulator [Ciceribacter sp. L1K23]
MFADREIATGELEPCGLPEHEDCGLRLVLDRLGERWTVMTVAELSAGPRRYRELQRGLDGITQRMLTLTVRRLERDGYVSRVVEPTNPPSVTYELTPRGKSFAAIAGRLVDWARVEKPFIEASRRAFDSRN